MTSLAAIIIANAEHADALRKALHGRIADGNITNLEDAVTFLDAWCDGLKIMADTVRQVRAEEV